jgi:hypothetical protein
MVEISYKCYCNLGAVKNPKLSRRVLRDCRGNYITTRYYLMG